MKSPTWSFFSIYSLRTCFIADSTFASFVSSIPCRRWPDLDPWAHCVQYTSYPKIVTACANCHWDARGVSFVTIWCRDLLKKGASIIPAIPMAVPTCCNNLGIADVSDTMCLGAQLLLARGAFFLILSPTIWIIADSTLASLESAHSPTWNQLWSRQSWIGWRKNAHRARSNCAPGHVVSGTLATSR